jgi:hypothetical protein
VTPDALLALLRDVHKDKLGLRQRHAAVARRVPQYDANNTYQFVINREDLHLSWLDAAVADLGGTTEPVGEPAVPPLGRKESFTPLVAQDARDAEAFVARWRPRLGEVTHARHRNMLQLILGETLEQKRFFDQIAAGRTDQLGRRANGPGSPGTGDGVIDVRWIE